MNDQEKRELMTKAAVKFEGKWPSENDFKLEGIDTTGCIDGAILITHKVSPLYLTEGVGFVSLGDANASKKYYHVITQQEFEAFMDELADKAPEGATHYLPSNNFYYAKKDHAYCLVNEYGVHYHAQLDESAFDSLIPLPKRTEERPSIFIDGYLLPNRHDSETSIEFEFQYEHEDAIYYKDDQGYILRVGKINPDEDNKVLNIPINQVEPVPWVPEVGQECEAVDYDCGNEKYYQKARFIGDNPLDKTANSFKAFSCVDGGDLFWSDKFRPIRTEAEIECEELASDIIRIAKSITSDRFMPKEAEHEFTKLAENIYALGYRKANE